jgi:hypothetical protein
VELKTDKETLKHFLYLSSWREEFFFYLVRRETYFLFNVAFVVSSSLNCCPEPDIGAM